MKLYLLIVACGTLLAFNYFCVDAIFEAMNYRSTVSFFTGLGGLLLLLWTDTLIAIRVVRKPQPKGVPPDKANSSTGS
jgi:hypothetical protein